MLSRLYNIMSKKTASIVYDLETVITSSNHTELHLEQAIKNNSLDALRALLESSMSKWINLPKKYSPQLLADLGITNQKKSMVLPLLHMAIYFDHSKIIELLLEYKANPILMGET